MKTAKNRIDKLAEEKAKALVVNYTPFTFHDLKKKGVSDTEGNKQEASGHKTASMAAMYDLSVVVVNQAGRENDKK